MRTVNRDGVVWVVSEPGLPGSGSFWEMWEQGWESETLAVIDRFVGPEDVFLDVGAYMGALSLWATRNGAGAIAVEPDPLACAYLRQNLANAAGPVRVVQKALSRDSLTTWLQPHKSGWGSSMSHLSAVKPQQSAEDIPDSLEVPTCGIVELGAEQPALVKLDIEGGECLVLGEVAPYCAEREIPLLVSWHPLAWTNPINQRWFEGFSGSEVITPGDNGSELYLP
jgi:FkbM family methyltransferase